MTDTVLLYGATGYSGKLIVAEAARVWKDLPNLRLVLASRDGPRVQRLADRYGMDFRAFALDDPEAVTRNVRGASVILNAAGPFCRTAQVLARAALSEPCHYVDIGGEFDVYRRLDDLRRVAKLQKIVMVCGAAYCAAASDILLAQAIRGLEPNAEFGAIRMAFSRPVHVSRGSAETALRLLREQVAVLRDFGAGDKRSLGLWHVPAGMLERSFTLGEGRVESMGKVRERERVATAVSLVDTLAAAHTIGGLKKKVRSVECYLEMGAITRVGMPLAGLAAPFLTLPGPRMLARMQLDLLPEGPTERERANDPARMVLTIDDPAGVPIYAQRLTTPNSYDFTARIALEIVRHLMRKGPVDEFEAGWRTPSQVLKDVKFSGASTGPLRDCRLEQLLH